MGFFQKKTFRSKFDSSSLLFKKMGLRYPSILPFLYKNIPTGDETINNFLTIRQILPIRQLMDDYACEYTAPFESETTFKT